MRIHFIGIGGIGTSALAQYYLWQGHFVSGSDLQETEITKLLRRRGAEIKIGRHKKSNLPKNIDLVVHTAAVKRNNPELSAARQMRAKIKLYAQAVGELTRRYRTIAIAGAHGKSTTTAFTALVLEDGHCDPTVIVGTKLKEFGNTNFRRGCGPYLVLEADEYNKSFLNYQPHIVVITNIDTEHLDTYKNFKGIKEAFYKFLEQVPSDGFIIANGQDQTVRQIVKDFKPRVHYYSSKDKEAAYIKKIIKIPGQHNVLNALAAAKVGEILGIRFSDILHALSRFKGAWRRFEFKGMLNGAYVFDDYAHHPREIKATIQAARERFPWRRIWCVFQPHHYGRLKDLWGDFVSCFDEADKIVFLPVFEVTGREKKRRSKNINSANLAQAVAERGKFTKYISRLEKVKDYLGAYVRKGDVVLLMGAGDIYKIEI